MSLPPPPTRVNYDSSFAAAASESIALAALISNGYPCYVPFGVGKADLIIETAAGFRTIQCKTARLDRGALRFHTTSRNSQGKDLSYKGLIDYFAVTCPDYSGVFLVPVDDCPANEAALRIEPPRNGQRRNIRFAADYVLTTCSVRASNA